MAAALEPDGGNQPLELRRVGGRLCACHLPPHHILPRIIRLAQIEGAPGCALGEDVVREPGHVHVALLADDEREDGNVDVENKPADGWDFRSICSCGRAS